MAEEAIAIARRLDDTSAVIAALIGLLSLPDRPDSEHLRWADEVIDLATAVDDQVSLAIAAGSAVTSAASFADRDRLERYLAVCAAAAERVGLSELVWRSMGTHALEAIVNGDLAAAERIANEILPAATDMGYALIWYGSIIITVRAQQGRGPEIRPSLDGIVASAEGTTAAEIGASGDSSGRPPGGRRRRGARRLRGRGSCRVPGARRSAMANEEVHQRVRVLRSGRSRPGRALLEDLAPNAALLPASPSVLLFSAAACAGMLAALLDEHDEADGHFAHAIALTAAFRAPYLLASGNSSGPEPSSDATTRSPTRRERSSRMHSLRPAVTATERSSAMRSISGETGV